MTFRINPDLIENNDVEIVTENGELVIRHVPTGQTVALDDAGTFSATALDTSSASVTNDVSAGAIDAADARINGRPVSMNDSVEVNVPTDYDTIQAAIDDLLPYAVTHEVVIRPEAGHTEGDIRIPDYQVGVHDQEAGDGTTRTRSGGLTIRGVHSDPTEVEVNSIYVAGGAGPSDPQIRQLSIVGHVPDYRPGEREVGLVIAGGASAAVWDVSFAASTLDPANDNEPTAIELYDADINGRNIDFGTGNFDTAISCKRGSFSRLQNCSGHVAVRAYRTDLGRISVSGNSITSDGEIFSPRRGEIFDEDTTHAYSPGSLGWRHVDTVDIQGTASQYQLTLDDALSQGDVLWMDCDDLSVNSFETIEMTIDTAGAGEYIYEPHNVTPVESADAWQLWHDGSYGQWAPDIYIRNNGRTGLTQTVSPARYNRGDWIEHGWTTAGGSPSTVTITSTGTDTLRLSGKIYRRSVK